MTPKETIWVKAKLEGLNQLEAGTLAGAKTKEAALKLSKRMSDKVHIQQALQGAQELSLLEAGITRSKALKPIAEALEATKSIVYGKGTEDSWVDIVPDHTTRLSASKMALQLLDKDIEPIDKPIKNPLLNSKLDEIQLARLMFSDKDVSEPIPNK